MATMRRLFSTNRDVGRPSILPESTLPALALLLLAPAGLGAAQNSHPQPASVKSAPKTQRSQANQKTFSSAQDAASALYQAAHNDDENELLVILGPGAQDMVIWTDDPQQRKEDAQQFAQKYDQMHRLVKEPDDETTLYVGAENWPLPIPIVQHNGQWHFDTSLGRQEVVFRRVGQNEMNAIDVLHGLTEAENEFYDDQDSGSPAEYSPRLNSDPGTHDGLFWQATSKNNVESPIGPYLAQASYSQNDHKPLHGYYFRVLTQQGPNAAGGARNYVVNGKMTGGFAFVAFPADYRSSGVMTFMICQDGAIFEKDLGPSTTHSAAAMTAFNPDRTWTRVP